jgi:glycosyltransferase involved in cell wall biosynthesis
MQKVAIIIPCYNEALRLQPSSYTSFLTNHPDVVIFFVDDGSKDGTIKILQGIAKVATLQVKIISNQKRKGKAYSIRKGLIEAMKVRFSYYGYVDADLSAPLNEFYRLYMIAVNEGKDFILGSRIKILNADIYRSFFRHIVGRSIATIIDWKFRLGIYDTQCGCKIFSYQIIPIVTGQPFKTKWFFDVEILVLIKKNSLLKKGSEIPLLEWKNVGRSKIGILNFPLVAKELFILLKL